MRVTVLGTGLIGGSIGLALRELGLAGRVMGIGRREANIAEAVRIGAIDAATTDLASASRAANGRSACRVERGGSRGPTNMWLSGQFNPSKSIAGTPVWNMTSTVSQGSWKGLSA